MTQQGSKFGPRHREREKRREKSGLFTLQSWVQILAVADNGIEKKLNRNSVQYYIHGDLIIIPKKVGEWCEFDQEVNIRRSRLDRFFFSLNFGSPSVNTESAFEGAREEDLE